MSKLDLESRMTIKTMLAKGVTASAVARLLGVTEGAVRYQARRMQSGAIDRRSLEHDHGFRGIFWNFQADWLRDRGGVSLEDLDQLDPRGKSLLVCQDMRDLSSVPQCAARPQVLYAPSTH